MDFLYKSYTFLYIIIRCLIFCACDDSTAHQIKEVVCSRENGEVQKIDRQETTDRLPLWDIHVGRKIIPQFHIAILFLFFDV